MGPPNRIRLSKSCIGTSEKEAVLQVLDQEYLGMGPRVMEFERLLTEYFGRPAVCVVNGTSALQLSLQALGASIGDEILVPSITYVASFQAIAATGAKPVACDVDPATLCLDIYDASRRLTKNTKALMPVHYAGGVGALSSYYHFADEHGLRIVEDAAHALGTTFEENLIGGIGDISCFSFDGIKNITSGEGGCIVTDDNEILNRVRDARLLGVKNDTDARFRGERSWSFDVTHQGWRYHMSDIMAAIGIAQFARREEFSNKRKMLAKRYCENFKDQSKISPLIEDFSGITPHIFVIKINVHVNRDVLRKNLLAKGIETGVHYPPNHLLEYFRDANAAPLPATDAVFPKILSLPLHVDLSVEEVDKVSADLVSELADCE